MSKIGFCMVAGDMMHTKTAYDCIKTVGYQTNACGDEIILMHQSGSVLAEARQKAMKSLYDQGCDWIFCVDSDMRFPVNTIQGMMSHDLPVVAANCSKRKRPIGPTARRKSAWLRNDNDESEAVYPDKNRTGVERVETVGFGVILIRRDVLDAIEWPWFDMPWHEEAQRHVGEDIFFCGRCHEAGVPVYIDHDLSWAVYHTGLYDYGMRDCVTEAQLKDSGAWDESIAKENARRAEIAGAA